MIKGISSINGLIKAGALAAMLAGSTALYASNPIKKDAHPNQTEVVSPEGAEAIKAASMQNITQAAVPKVHNPNLDAALRKYIETDEDKKEIENFINNVYKNNGTYLGSAIMQHEINLQHFCAFVNNSDLMIKNNINPQVGKEIKNFGPKFYKTMEPEKENVMTWVKRTYNGMFAKRFAFNSIPNTIDVHDRITEYVSKAISLGKDDRIKYLDLVYEYLNKKEDMTGIQASSDLIAREIFILDKLMFNRILTRLGVFNDKQFKNGDKTMQDYFNQWMDSIKPDKNY